LIGPKKLKSAPFFGQDTPPLPGGSQRRGGERGWLLAGVARLGILRLARTRRSAVSVEIAAVAIPFFMLLLGSFEVSYDAFVQSAMNYAVSEAARDIWIGNAQGNMTSPAFVTNFVCPKVGFMLDCSLITMRVTPIRPITSNDFWQTMTTPPVGPGPLPYYSTGTGRSATLTTNSWSVCTGGPGEAVLVEGVYAGPTFVGGFIPSMVVNTASGLVHPTYAAQGFINQTTFIATAAC
jgi:Flp pilus assembly protein TadG